MLRKNGGRALAYIVTVDKVEPIEGYDRIDLATVGGWRCVVARGMAAGDKAVYFEIDSLLPRDDKRFAFCEKYKWRVKTQRMCRGAVLSQGLLMPLWDFPELQGLDVGTDVTARLKVTYYETEDNARKAPSVDRYKAMARRNGKLFSRQPFRWLMRRGWGRQLLFLIFGRRDDKRRAWPAWVRKTDEERCLSGRTKVDTDAGKILISKIVNQRLPLKVKSVNLTTGEIEYKPIVSYQKYRTEEPLIDVEFVQINGGDTKRNRVICTEDHKFYTQRGYVAAKDLRQDDYLTRSVNTISRNALPVLYGMMLGDGCVHWDKRNGCHRARFSYSQNVNHREYYELVRVSFGAPKTYLTRSGYTGNQSVLRFGFADQLCETALRHVGAIDGERFRVTEEFCNMLTPLSLAVWFMDDGTCRHRDDDSLRCTGEISSNAFTKRENEYLIAMLAERFGVSCSLKYDATRGFYSIYITADGMHVLSRIIAKYVPACMRYKIEAGIADELKYDGGAWPHDEATESLIEATVTTVSNFVNHTHSYHENGTVYDIEVADNHNFFANGVLTHNCQNVPWILADPIEWVATEKVDGTSATFTLRRRRMRKPEFTVCSRNVSFGDGSGEDNVYTATARLYHMRELLEELLAERPEAKWVTVQGEIYGAGIQRRDYSRGDHRLAVFNLIYSDSGRMGYLDMAALIKGRVPLVPLIDRGMRLPDDVDEVLRLADGDSAIDGGMREGIVFRSQDGKQSFKAVSNEYLLKYHG